jgi:hypothetical protein
MAKLDQRLSRLRWLFAAVALAALPSAATAGRAEPPSPPAPPWEKFVKAEGHASEIPAQWMETPEGRFAHSIKLPDSIPKTMPFDFGGARLKSLAPGGPGVAQQYWEHLCATEAGSFILKTVNNVEGFAFLRAVGGMNEQELRDRWQKEAPSLQADAAWRYNPLNEAVGYVNPPQATYLYVEYPDPDRAGAFWKLTGHVFRKQNFAVEREPNPTSRYAVTWRGIHRPKDRAYLISGYEWIVLDRSTGDVLAVFRDFGMTGFTRNEKDGIYWLNAARCPFRKAAFGRMSGTEAAVWIPRVLAPETYPEALRFIDKLRGDTK